MNIKICKKCLRKKNANEFREKRNICRECEREYAREYRHKNTELVLSRTHNWRARNKDKIKEYNKKTRKKYKCKDIEKRKQYLKNYMKEWRKNNKEHINKYKLDDYYKKKQDILYKIKIQIRNLIYNSFKKKNYKKNGKTEKILGCNYNDFANHLLQTYKNNYGIEWNGIDKVHIDHIIPLATAKTEDDVIKLCHYTNLQLLKEKDNLRKNSKLNWNIKEGKNEINS